MKKVLTAVLFTILTLCLTAAALADVEINETNFPDGPFRDFVRSSYDADGDDVLSSGEIEAVTDMYCGYNKIQNLEGIGFFTSLEKLDCRGNALTSLDVSGNTALKDLDCSENRLSEFRFGSGLTRLHCHENQLAGLDLSAAPALTEVYCMENQLTGLDVSANRALTMLICSENELTSLTVGSGAMEWLDFRNNLVPAVDVSGCASLKYLFADNNRLTSVDVSKNAALTDLFCGSNMLTSLDVSGNAALSCLSCGSNRLTELRIGRGLELIVCRNNQLAELDVSENAGLEILNCENNRLKKLDLSNNTAMKELTCQGNRITALDLTKCAALLEFFEEVKPEDRSTYWCYEEFYRDTDTFQLSFDKKVRVLPAWLDPSAPPESIAATIGALKYSLADGQATVTGPKSKTAASLSIPASVKYKGKSYKVTGIRADAFKGMSRLTKAAIGKNVAVIEKNAFASCKKLKTVSLGAGVATIGDDAFKAAAVFADHVLIENIERCPVRFGEHRRIDAADTEMSGCIDCEIRSQHSESFLPGGQSPRFLYPVYL